MSKSVVQCETCGKSFEKENGEINRSKAIGRRMFCSESCGTTFYHNLRKKLAIEEYSANPKRCKECGTPIDFEWRLTNIFCSRSCAAKYNQPRRCKNPTNTFCIECGKEISRRRKFCSRTCLSKHQIKATDKRILSGEKVNLQNVRRYLIRTRVS